MKCEIVNVTPSLASKWLATSQGNPRYGKTNNNKVVDERVVNAIASDIKSGAWYLGNNSIAFDEDGCLVDGHHRLSAVVKAGQTVQMLVVYGVSKEGQLHIDDNRGRREAQRTGISPQILGCPRLHYMAVNGFKNASLVLTTENKLRWIDLHPAVYECDRLIHGTKLAKNSKALHAILCAFEFGVSQTKVKRFLECVNSGFVDGSHEQAAIVVRNFLLSTKRSYRNEAPKCSETFIDNVIQAGLYDFVRGLPRTRPYMPKRGVYFDLNIAHGDKRYTSLYGELKDDGDSKNGVECERLP